MESNYYELTNPQKNIWNMENYFDSTNINNICTSVTINEQIDEELLKKSIYNLVKNNDSFRIKISIIDNIPKQHFSQFSKFDIPVIKLDNEDELFDLESKIVNQRFELLNGELFKFYIIKFSNGHGAIICNVHHIISDSWSLGITIKSILKDYKNLINNKESITEQKSYSNFILSEQKYITSSKFESDKEFWKNTFNTIPDLVSLPSSKKPKSYYSCNAKRKSFTLSQKIVNSVKEYCKDNKISMYDFFMCIYAIYNSRVSSLNNFVIGTPILNRLNFNDKTTTGMFVNTIPITFNINQESTFKDFISEFGKNMFQVLRHQRYSYNQILSDLRASNKNVPNLFNTIISYQITNANDTSLCDYHSNWIFNNKCGNDFNIHILDINDTGKLFFEYDYLCDKFAPSDINQYHDCIINIINQVIGNPDILVKDINLLGNAAKQEILDSINESFNKFHTEKNIIDIFNEQVTKSPNKIAVTFNDQSLTYKQLDNYSNCLANKILENNTNLEDTVAIFLDKSIEMIISILAILKAGCNYLPVDIDYPEERINFMLEDSSSKVLLHMSNTDLSKIQYNVSKINVSLDSFKYDDQSIQPNLNINRTNLAYTMYTSGSTGKPKGVMIEQKSIIRLVKNTNFITFKKNDIILQTGSIVFDACTFEIWGALLNGLTLSIISKASLLNPVLLKEHIIKNKITIMWLTAPLFNMLCEQDPTIFTSIKYLLTGGDVLSPKHINLALENNPDLKIINGYGPTENTTFSCCFPITKKYNSAIPIGYPITNSTCYIVSNTGTIQPYNVPGELWVGGEGVARGYLNRDELTKNSFIDDYFLGYGKIYKTGDLVKINYDNEIEFLGRIDHQVKIHGFRIELNEINLKILSFNDVKQSFTTVLTINNAKKICSYIVFNEENKKEELIKYLKEKLASYMMPSYIIVLDSLPLNVNGKVDKNLLPLPELSSERKIVLPSNDIQKYLIKSLNDILKINEISINDSFVDIGGDSLSAVAFSSYIERQYKINISIKDILDESISIADISEMIRNSSEINSSTIEKYEELEYYPLSFAQKRIYYTCKMIGENNLVYNLPGAFVIDKYLDKNKVEECFNKIIEAQSSLRTCFYIKDNEVVQKVLPHVKFKVDTFNAKASSIKKIINNYPAPFDLEQAPLLRVSLCYLDNGKTLLLMDTHHIIMDGSSLEILLKQFCSLYNDESINNNEINYTDFCLWEKESINSKEFIDSEKYWLNKFSNRELPALNLHYDYSMPSTKSYVGNIITKKFNKTNYKKYLEYANKLGVSPYVFFLSAFIILLYKYSGQNEIIIGSPTANRNNYKLKNIIGMFVNNMVIDSNIDSNSTFLDFLNSTKKEILSNLEHQNYPYDLLVKKLNINVNDNHNPLFDVMFTYHHFDIDQLNIENQEVSLQKSNLNISKFNLTFEIDSNNRAVNIEYRSDLFNDTTINRLFSHFENILNNILNNCYSKIKDISIISEDEQNIILNEFNNTKLIYPKNKNLVNLFKKIVEKYPNNVAVKHKSQSITYAELDSKSDILATKLLLNQIQPGDCIGVCLTKSIDLIVSIWAILKINCTYIPMYVNYPKERLDYMTSNSNTKVIITTKEQNKIHDFNIPTIVIDNINYNVPVDFNYDTNYSNENIAYIIYTSGSTGRPKGVQITHKNLINFLFSMKHLYQNDISVKDSFLSSTNISFDVSIFELFLPIINGSTLVLYEEEIISDIIKYCSCIVDNKITALYIPPNILNEVYNILKDSKNLYINKMLVGVEAITKSTLNKYLTLNPDMKIVNGYGPTETTICCSALNYEYDNSNDDIVSIGKPLNNDQIYILDNDMNIQPIGITGNLYVTGDGVGAGYINNPTETEKNYLPNNMNINSKKMYNTGDLARWNPDGTINFIGRNDSQIKISGHRIELKEINYSIMQYPNVTKAYTTIQKNGSNTFIVSYFIAENDVQIKDLQTFLKSRLANYMIPTFIKQLDSFPLTINGKIDKAKLPQLNFDTQKYVAPRNESEKIIISIWKKLFLLEKIGIDDNFFNLGGDSLTAIKFQIEALNNGLNITYSDIFSHPTPRELAEKDNNSVVDIDYSISKNYDYKKINNLMLKNNIDNIEVFKESLKTLNKQDNLGNILLIGATGFLGAHILDYFLSNYKGKIYCLIRKKSLLDPEERLRKTLNFYFDNKYDYDFGNRIIVINGDIINKNFNVDNDTLKEISQNIDSVIDSAALVKHYGSFEQFNDINVVGTQNVIDFCTKYNKKLFYISTISIAGNGPSKNNNLTYFKESNFYINQNLNNVYLYTKFEAEKMIYENILNNNLSACVLRVGNITNRYEDGKFQINTSENAFVNRIKSILKLGQIQNKYLDHSVEFTPVDKAAEAILKIANSKPNFTTFHIYNSKFIRIDTLLAYLNSLDIHLKPVSDEEFAKTVTRFLNSDSLRNEISGIVTDLDKNKLLTLINNTLPNSEFSEYYLKLLDYDWPNIDIDYLKKYIKYFNSIKYIE